MIETLDKRQYEQLRVEIYPNNDKLGEAAAVHAASILSDAISARGYANLILATGNSQLTFLRSLASDESVDWSRITIFHMDEYVGIGDSHPASFRRFLHEKIIGYVHPATFHGIAGDAPDIQAECRRYEALLREHVVDLCCMGIGENGHLAFNDPPYADFHDSHWVKEVKLDERSRTQQVGEGHFPSLDAVPQNAITLTIPALLAAENVLVFVPEARKADAVKQALEGPITPDCPASILRQTPHARLLLDAASSSLLT
jgi:glucosamine-6-phosphate deaminase